MKLALLVLAVGCGQSSPPGDDPEPNTHDGDGAGDDDDDADDPVPPADGDEDGDGHAVPDDCDDTDPTVFPGAPDLCGDDRVTDCARLSDDGLVTVDGGRTFADLREALAEASEGSEVRICAGTFPGPFLATRPVHLVGHAGAALTVLDGDDLGSALTVPGGSTVTGLSLTNGTASEGGGLNLVTAGTLTMTDCEVHDNVAQRGGGVWLAPGAVASFPGTTVASNQARNGGGMFAWSASLDLTDAVLDSNAAEAGGGLYLVDADVTGGVVRLNVTQPPQAYTQDPTGGAGVYLQGDVSVTGTDIGENEARNNPSNSANGGGLRAALGSLALTDVAVHDNVAEAGSGGGISAYQVDLVLTGTTVSGNEASIGGGAHLSLGSWVGGEITDNVAAFQGGGMRLDNVALVEDVAVRRNRAEEAGGGIDGFWVAGFRGCTFEENTAPVGGGIYAVAGEAYYGGPFEPIVIEDSSFVGNEAETRGGALNLAAGEVRIVSTTITDNGAALGGGLSTIAGVTEFVSSTILRNQAGEGGGVYLEYGSEVVSTGSDWGVGADDNVSTDVNDVAGYGAGAMFACDRTRCVPAP